VDTSPPPAPAITSNPPTWSNDNTPSFAFNDSEAGVTFQCKLDGAAYGACTSPKVYGSTPDGSHTFSVQAKDAAGNVSTATSYTWNVLTVKPPKAVITSTPPDPSSNTSSTFTFTSSYAYFDHFECSLEDGPWFTCTSPATYNLATGNHEFAVQVVDRAGNISDEVDYHWKITATAGMPFTIAGNATSTLYPGGQASPIDLVFTNPNTSPITITGATVTVSGTSAAGCAAGNFTLTQQLTATPVIPANSTRSLSDLGVPQSQWPMLKMLDSGNQMVCRLATVNLSYAGTATG